MAVAEVEAGGTKAGGPPNRDVRGVRELLGSSVRRRRTRLPGQQAESKRAIRNEAASLPSVRGTNGGCGNEEWVRQRRSAAALGMCRTRCQSWEQLFGFAGNRRKPSEALLEETSMAWSKKPHDAKEHSRAPGSSSKDEESEWAILTILSSLMGPWADSWDVAGTASRRSETGSKPGTKGGGKAGLSREGSE